MNNRRLGGCPILLLLSVCTSRLDAMVVDSNYDLVVYGATSGGVMAAVSAARAGVSIVTQENSLRIKKGSLLPNYYADAPPPIYVRIY